MTIAAIDTNKIAGRFMIWVTLVLVAGGFAIWLLTVQANRSFFESVGEQVNVDIANLITDNNIDDLSDLIKNYPSSGPLAHNDSEVFMKLSNYLRARTSLKGILKIIIYDLEGVTIYSTEEGELGKIKNNNHGIDAALKGNTVTELVPEDEYDEFEQQTASQNLIETYLPLKNSQGQIIGVFEVYSDGSTVLASIDQFRGIVTGIFVIVGVIIFGILFIALKRIEGKLLESINDRAKLRAEADQLAEMNRAKTEFLALLSHELRTPLNAIVGFSDLMNQEIFGRIEPEKYRTYITEIHSSGQELTGILNKVLFMSSLVTNAIEPDPRVFDMKQAVNAALDHHKEAASKRQITLNVTQPSEPLELNCDFSHVVDAISNLISNAVKFSPTGSIVTIGHGICNKTIVTDGLCHDDPCVVVSDAGPGIDPDKRKELMQVFSQAESSLTQTSGGMGLGLPIAQALASLNGGEIVVGDVPGGGARVALVFPDTVLAPLNWSEQAAA